MQLFRRDKRDDEAKTENGQEATAVGWYESMEERRQMAAPSPDQNVQTAVTDYGQIVSRPHAPVSPPAQRDVIPEQTRSVPAMSNIARENLPYPDLPVQGGSRQARSAGGQATVIDAQSHFTGNYRSDSDLIVEGTFEGEIECNGTVSVAESATLSATVKARNVIVAGSANGEITCDERFTIRSTGEMRGKAQAATLVVEEGAFFEGEFRMGGGYSGATSASYSGWESAQKATPTAAESSAYSMSVDQSDLGDMEEDAAEAEADSFSVDDLWDEDEKTEDQ